MKQNTLDPERQKMLCNYLEALNSSTLCYATRGKYVEAVRFFLMNADTVSRRGYNNFKKAHQQEIVYMPWMTDAVPDFLASIGKGYRKVEGDLYKGGNKRFVDNIEKREIRQNDTINNFILWLTNERDYSENTLRTYTFSVQDYYSYFDEFTQENCRKYVANLEQKGYSPKTTRIRITCLEKLGEYLKKPVRLKRPKIQKTLSTENIPTEAEYQKLLDYADTHNQKFAYIIRLLGTTGCRVSELVQFTYEMVQEGSTVLKGKGSKYRQFFFTRQMQEQAKGKSGYICINHYGAQMSTRGIAMMLKDLGEKAGIAKEKMHPHAFRHFFAKMYLKKTKDVVGLADLLGHGSIDITRIYLQKSKEEQKRAYNRNITW